MEQKGAHRIPPRAEDRGTADGFWDMERQFSLGVEVGHAPVDGPYLWVYGQNKLNLVVYKKKTTEGVGGYGSEMGGVYRINLHCIKSSIN